MRPDAHNLTTVMALSVVSAAFVVAVGLTYRGNAELVSHAAFRLPTTAQMSDALPNVIRLPLFHEIEHFDAAKGVVLFNPPDKMLVGQRADMSVELAMGATDRIRDEMKRLGKVEKHYLEVGHLMEVKLDGGDAFRIDNHGIPEDQFVRDDYSTTWSYQITALKSGRQKLYLAVGVRVRDKSGREERYYYPVFVQDIQVNFNVITITASFISENWRWLGTVLLAPGILAFIRLRWRRHEEKRAKRLESRVVVARETDVSSFGGRT